MTRLRTALITFCFLIAAGLLITTDTAAAAYPHGIIDIQLQEADSYPGATQYLVVHEHGSQLLPKTALDYVARSRYAEAAKLSKDIIDIGGNRVQWNYRQRYNAPGSAIVTIQIFVRR